MPKDHFRSRGFIESGVVKNADNIALDIAALPPFLRTLLVADGTVTKSLEAFFWERVDVETIDQKQISLDSPLPALNASIGDSVLKRDIRLRGADSGYVFAHASSYLRMDLLDDEIKNNLLAGRIGIGELIREIGIETYREIIDLGERQSEAGDKSIYRTYIIYIGHQATIQISEVFPLGIYET